MLKQLEARVKGRRRSVDPLDLTVDSACSSAVSFAAVNLTTDPV
ncbi:MAG: hypothetical protein AAF550_08105 [Myxococcota bacterium]